MRRSNQSAVTLTKPFRLRALDEMVPAGTYTVETEEEQVDGLSVVAYRRVSSVVLVPGSHPGEVQVVPVEPSELEAILLEDGAAG